MALRTCNDCDNQISAVADSCPRCGRLTDSELLRLIIRVVLSLLIVLLLAIF